MYHRINEIYACFSTFYFALIEFTKIVLDYVIIYLIIGVPCQDVNSMKADSFIFYSQQTDSLSHRDLRGTPAFIINLIPSRYIQYV